VFRTTSRSEGIASFAEETLKCHLPSNFTAHAEGCTSRPMSQSWVKFQEAEDRAFRGLPPLADGSGPSPVDAQRDMMQAFVQRGIENPAKSVTQPDLADGLAKTACPA
jgi:hypothetical protein